MCNCGGFGPEVSGGAGGPPAESSRGAHPHGETERVGPRRLRGSRPVRTDRSSAVQRETKPGCFVRSSAASSGFTASWVILSGTGMFPEIKENRVAQIQASSKNNLMRIESP